MDDGDENSSQDESPQSDGNGGRKRFGRLCKDKKDEDEEEEEMESVEHDNPEEQLASVLEPSPKSNQKNKDLGNKTKK